MKPNSLCDLSWLSGIELHGAVLPNGRSQIAGLCIEGEGRPLVYSAGLALELDQELPNMPPCVLHIMYYILIWLI